MRAVYLNLDLRFFVCFNRILYFIITIGILYAKSILYRETHITFYFMGDEDTDFSEDTNESEEYYILQYS